MNKKAKRIIITGILFFLLIFGIYVYWAGKRGCCSHHRGICGCDYPTNRVKCCDGTLSPTCTCDQPD